MTDFDFEVIDESEVVTSGRGGGKGKKKLPKWESPLSWNKPGLPDKFWESRGYGQPTKEDFEEIEKARIESLIRQNKKIDDWLKLMGIRKANVLEVRNQKVVVIKL